ncbi:Alpha/Beta hydrolase protein [Talaromyces proteolyticus]|uniref:Alpha/Beta hydrolase protein n=1 Tax=Talaromyces proteolyticus TaxID=1131652 RepID=A0AAD4PS40_9EURO|nr:Alpha/Beta hydrolase protein [Talaromyces proteolyticus]KAH8690340.1 Alpha/Beta hydrolase protein [Talaromyces proteolyticus]
MQLNVKFPSDGETIAGILFRPDDAQGKLPTVICAGGWCYTKEIVLPHIARIVNEGGVQVLAFDYAGFGESSGKRRQHLDPWQQISDYRNALTYAEGRDDVDPSRLGCLGISYSGGHVLILAAIDPRIKAVVSIVPVVDGYNNLRRAHGERRFADLEAAILHDQKARAAGKNEGKIAMASRTPYDELSVWPFPRVNEVFTQVKETEAPLHEHWSTMESAELLLNYSVSPFLPRVINTNVMMIVAEGDNITAWDLEIEAFNKIPSPSKQVQILPGVSHMSLYSDRADTNVAAVHSREWFSKML